MTVRPIMDAGPGLNFLASHRERLLISVLGPISIPETVRDEILHKANCDRRFEPARRVLQKLLPKYVDVLSDEVTADLAVTIQRMCGISFDQRICHRRDLGETMVIAHAAVVAEKGANVIVLIDERKGSQSAAREAARLVRLRNSGRKVGSIEVVNTVTILEKAAGSQYLPDRRELRRVYSQLKGLDDGLLPLENTGLLELPCWSL